jgi:hypothetical protein
MTNSGNDLDGEVIELGTGQSGPGTLIRFALLLLNGRDVRMNSGEHSTISSVSLWVRAFFAPDKAFLSDENEAVISHTDGKNSQISTLISSRDHVKSMASP